MKFVFSTAYSLVLALWIGGIAVFTFFVTPTIFQSYARDMAGDIVGKLFPGYFLINLALAVLALVLLYLAAENRSRFVFRLSLVCVSTALLINLFIVFKLHPDTVAVKQRVASFERESPDSPARKEFRRLHGLSAVLNLILLGEGIALLIAAPSVKK